MDNEKIQHIIELIKTSDLDDTIKNILIRDLEAEGLTDFLKEQIKAYCLEGIKKHNDIIDRASKILSEDQAQTNPA